MTTIDIIILIIIAAGSVLGFMAGFIKQLSSLLGLMLGLIAAKMLYAPLAEQLCPTVTDSMNVAQILAFVMIWVAVPLLFALVASILTKAIEAISLGWLNRCLGSFLGLLKYTLVLSLLLNVIDFIDPKGHMISETNRNSSLLYKPVKNMAGLFLPAAKQMTQQYLLKDDTARRTK